MSLINNMLKDLEKREPHKTGMPYIGIVNSKSSPSFFNAQKKIFLLGVAIALAVMFMVVLLFNNPHPVMATMLKDNIVKSSLLAANDKDANWLKPVSITGVTLQVKDNITEISFLLDHAALYRLTSDNMQNQLSLILDHAQLQSELPSINYLNTAVQNIALETKNDGIKFTLTLLPGAVLKYVNLNDEEKNPQLVIAIENQPADTTVKNDFSANAVKTPAVRSMLLQQYQGALSAAENSDFNSAIEKLYALIKMDPYYNDARVSLVALLMDQGGQVQARQLVDDGLKLYPAYIPFIELKARMLTTEGKIKNALALLQTTSPSINDNPDYHAFIAALYQRSNKDALAVNLYNRLLALNPHNGSWWFGLAISLEKTNHVKDAVQAYTRAMTEGHLSADSLAYLQTRLEALQEGNDVKG